ncbi:MAG TPA: ROK family protein [Bryobacteraceae bacterium]|nr:ROK family protein [Bryobacteraceae bacterium]
MKILVLDVGGTHVKMLLAGEKEPRRVDSGPKMTPRKMVAAVKKTAAGWKYDRISIGYPGPVLRNRVMAEPHNLGKGWMGFKFERAFGCPVRVVNDAAMQALGSYHGGKMLFLGLGTGLGTALVLDGVVEPMELSHLPYRKGVYEDYVGQKSLEKHGKKKWRQYVKDVVDRLVTALEPDDIVIGGGNVKMLKKLPAGARAGNNDNAFAGGLRLWDPETPRPAVRVKRGKSL